MRLATRISALAGTLFTLPPPYFGLLMFRLESQHISAYFRSGSECSGSISQNHTKKIRKSQFFDIVIFIDHNLLK